MIQLYINIKNLRLEKKLSQEDLAKLTDYTDRSSIAKIEQGLVDLPQSKIILFAKALGVTPGRLMGDVCPPAAPSLRPDEQKLLSDYNELNDTGKAKVREYASDLSEQTKYIAAEPIKRERGMKRT